MPTEIKRICLGAKTSILKCKGRVNTSDFLQVGVFFQMVKHNIVKIAVTKYLIIIFRKVIHQSRFYIMFYKK